MSSGDNIVTTSVFFSGFYSQFEADYFDLVRNATIGRGFCLRDVAGCSVTLIFVTTKTTVA